MICVETASHQGKVFRGDDTRVILTLGSGTKFNVNGAREVAVNYVNITPKYVQSALEAHGNLIREAVEETIQKCQ